MTHEEALLEIASLDKSDFEMALEKIVRIDSEVLGLERVNYWTVHRGDAPFIACELGYLRSLRSYERGQVLSGRDSPRYFDALLEGVVVASEDAPRDARTSELSEGYLGPRGITSMMLVPVWVRGQLVGWLGHEHVGLPRRWTVSDDEFAIAVAQAIAATVEARERGRAEQAEHRAAFLARATAMLSESLEIDEIPDRLVRLAVDELCDWCVLDLVDETGRLQRVAAAHADPALQPLLEELGRRYPPSAEDPHPGARAMQARGGLLVPDLNHELAAQYSADEGERELTRKLGARSIMAVALSARGRVFGAIAMSSAARRYGQEDLRLAQELARRGATALDNARLHREAKEAIALRDEFLSIAAHELYTPLTSLSLCLPELESPSPPNRERAVRVVGRSAERLTRLVDELLNGARTAAERAPLHLESVELVELVNAVVEKFDGEAKRAGCIVEVKADRPVQGRWDPARIEHLLGNLLGNAIKFGAGKPVEIEVSTSDSHAFVRVRDQGIGIEPAQLPRIFNRFERAVSMRQYGGLGLGLYIARRIAEEQGGTIRAESHLGGGSTFTVELPLGTESIPSAGTK